MCLTDFIENNRNSVIIIFIMCIIISKNGVCKKGRNYSVSASSVTDEVNYPKSFDAFYSFFFFGIEFTLFRSINE